jgi:hypothetical protein
MNLAADKTPQNWMVVRADTKTDTKGVKAGIVGL